MGMREWASAELDRGYPRRMARAPEDGPEQPPAGAGLGGSSDNPPGESGEPPLRDTPPRPRPGGGFGKGSKHSEATKAKLRQRARERASGKTGASSTPRTPPPSKTKAQRTRELELALGRMLVFPAVPSIMLPIETDSKAFLASHFQQTGPKVAHELAVASETSPELREILERFTEGSLTMVLAFAALAYLAPPALWMLGQRGPAQAVSLALQLDPEALESMIPPDAFPATGAQQPGSTDPQPAAEQAA